MGFPEGGPVSNFDLDPTLTGAADAVDLEAWNGAFKKSSTRVPIEDGTYQCRLTSLLPKSVGDEKKPTFEWQFEIVTGPCVGQTLYKTSWIGEKSMPFLKGDLERVGIKVAFLTEVPAAAMAVCGNYFEIKRSSRKNKSGGKDWTDVNIVKPLNGPPAGAAPPEPGPDAFSAPAPQPEAPTQPQPEAPPQQEAPTNDQNDKQVPF